MKMSATVDKNIIETELIKIIREILKDAAAEIDPEKSLMTQYGLDSLDLSGEQCRHHRCTAVSVDR